VHRGADGAVEQISAGGGWDIYGRSLARSSLSVSLSLSYPAGGFSFARARLPN
jgi:hypothetical protein